MVFSRGTRKAGAAPKKRSAASAGNPRKKTERKVMPWKKPPREIPKTGHETEQIRLNKYIASTGVCARREADEYIKAGLVSVNGKLITELGVKVSPGDVVKYNDETLREE